MSPRCCINCNSANWSVIHCYNRNVNVKVTTFRPALQYARTDWEGFFFFSAGLVFLGSSAGMLLHFNCWLLPHISPQAYKEQMTLSWLGSCRLTQWELSWNSSPFLQKVSITIAVVISKTTKIQTRNIQRKIMNSTWLYWESLYIIWSLFYTLLPPVMAIRGSLNSSHNVAHKMISFSPVPRKYLKAKEKWWHDGKYTMLQLLSW